VARQGRGEPAAGQLDHFKRAHDPAPVRREDRGGGPGVGGGQPGMQRPGADVGELRLQIGAQFGIGAGELEVVQGRVHVQARPAGQDRRTPRGQQAVDRRARHPLVLGDRGPAPSPARRRADGAERPAARPR